MMRPEEALRNLANPDAGTPVRIRLMVVSGVRDDGNVNLALGNQVLDGVPALASYAPRAPGDMVTVAQTGAGWLVLGKAGAEGSRTVVWDAITGRPTIVDLAFGPSGPPGAGWTKASAVYVKDGQLWVDTSTSGGGGGGSSTTPVPKPTPVSVVGDAAYRFGGLQDQANPIQGAWHTSSYPAWSGAWFYGTDIKAACDKGTVDWIDMHIVRSGASHGAYQPVPTRLYLHGATGVTNNTPALHTPFTGPRLGLGESRIFRLPASWVSALSAGTARGIGCFAEKGSEYLVYGACGGLTVHFK